MGLKVIALLLLVQQCFSSTLEGPIDFSQHQLVKIQPRNEDDIGYLMQLREVFNLDFWSEPRRDLHPLLMDIKIPDQLHILTKLNASSVPYEVVHPNVQTLIDAQKKSLYDDEDNLKTRKNRAFPYVDKYSTLDDIQAELKRVEGASAGFVKVTSIGKSSEGRDILAAVLTNPAAKRAEKKSVIMECGIHCREWISTASCLWIMNELLTNAESKALLDTFEFTIIPNVNPDGYVYTWTTNRKWRKTRRPNPGSSCVGTDANRNWDIDFGKVGVSKNPCSDTFCGEKPFTEPEAQAVADYVTKVVTSGKKVAAYFAVHSYSQLWMYPYAYKQAKPDNDAQLKTISVAATDAIRQTHQKSYKYGTIYDTIYPVSGSSIDWVYDKHQVKVAFAVELRDTGYYGFLLPPEQIKPNSEEFWNAIKATLKQV